jgi:Ca-activated chloride channel homolog
MSFLKSNNFKNFLKSKKIKKEGYLFETSSINIKHLIFYFMKAPINRATIVLALVLASCGPNKESKNTESGEIYCINITDSGSEEEYVNYAPPLVVENTEEYSKVKEQGFCSVKQNPYSTFSIDVDAASYSNMRRLLLQGELPPKNSVRIEEWINYFNYHYPQPYGKHPFSITTEYSDCPWNENHKLLHLGLKGKEMDQKDTPANNLVFLIDVSGSMDEPNKLPLLKKSFRLLLPKLRKKDRVAIVVYAGAAGVALKPTSGDDKLKIAEALDNLDAGGSTAGGEGIELAYKLAEENFMAKGNNRIIMATDGDFNLGVSSEQALEELITKKRDAGIYLSVIGFGDGNLKDNKMELLADKGNGNYNYIDNLLEARKILVQQFGGTLNTIAKDVKIQVEFNPKYVKEYRLIGYDNRRLEAADFNNDKKDAGELGSGHMVTALYEIVVAGSEEKNNNVDDLKYQTVNSSKEGGLELANIKFRYKNPSKNDTVSHLITQLVYNNKLDKKKTSANFKLASSVTEFGLVLGDSEFKNEASLDQAIELAKQSKGEDEEGYVGELIRLMSMAKDLGAEKELAEK